jgi:hypothetical protein
MVHHHGRFPDASENWLLAPPKPPMLYPPAVKYGELANLRAKWHWKNIQNAGFSS